MVVTSQEQASATGIGADAHEAGPDGPAATLHAYSLRNTVPTQVGRLRSDIEHIDRAIVELIARRVQVANEIGGAKRDAGVPVVDPAREASIVRSAGDLARKSGLPEDDVRDIFWRLVALSRRTQLESLSGAA